MYLIAEAGNCHFGSMEMAKEMIIAGKEAGADAVKFQAISAKEAIKTGSMPKAFYQEVAFTEDEYLKLIKYGKENDIDVFMSIFGPFSRLKPKMKRWKVSGGQVKNGSVNLRNYDKPNCIISLPNGIALPRIDSAAVLHVSDYLTDEPFLNRMDILKYNYKHNKIGYSDHTIGIDNCVKAVKDFEAKIIEKHFTLDKSLTYNDKIFRDQTHAATPDELAELAREIKG